jgi:hypothetical protein
MGRRVRTGRLIVKRSELKECGELLHASPELQDFLLVVIGTVDHFSVFG